MTDIYDKIVKNVHKRVKERDKKLANPKIYSTGNAIYTPTNEDEFVVGPEWWQKMTGTLGLPYGYIIQVAGTTDSGKCLSKESTYVITDNGVETLGKALRFNSSLVENKKVGYWHDDGFRKGLKIIFSDGSSIEGTPNHKIKVINENLDLIWKRLDEIEPNDYIPNIESYFPFNNQYNEDKAELLGWLFADGTFTGKEVRLCDLNPDKAEIVSGLMKKLDVYSENNHYFFLNREKTKELGLNVHTKSADKEIPEEILSSNKEAICAFLRGLLSGDGSMEQNNFSFSSSSYKMMNQVQFLLKSLGISCTKKESKVNGYEQTYYKLIITGGITSLKKLKDKIGISLPRKRERLDEYLKKKECSKAYIPHTGTFLKKIVNKEKIQITREQRRQFNVNFLTRGDNITVSNYEKLKSVINLPQSVQDKINPLCGMNFIQPIKVEPWEGKCADPNIPSDNTYIANNLITHNTSASIEYIRKAQEQGVYIILADTERKTTKLRFTQWGVDPKKMFLVRGNTLEDMYQGIDDYIAEIQAASPDSKILVIIDSLGNTPAEAEMNSTIRDSQQMAVRANINNKGFSRLVPRLEDKITVLVINQTYDNMGSPGKTNKGGKNKDFYSCITFQTSRIGWIERQVKGEKVRVGAKCKWTVYKNHLIDNDKLLGKQFEIDVTGDGMALKGEVPEKFHRVNDDGVIIDAETGEILE